LRNFSKLYWAGGDVVSAFAISSSPVDAFFFLVPVADPAAADPVVAAFVPLVVSDLVPADLVSAAHIPLADSFSSNFPSWIHELSKFRIGAQTVLHAQPSFFNSIILLSKHYVQGYIFAAQRVDQ
jgi:hypothetical protein